MRVWGGKAEGEVGHIPRRRDEAEKHDALGAICISFAFLFYPHLGPAGWGSAPHVRVGAAVRRRGLDESHSLLSVDLELELKPL